MGKVDSKGRVVLPKSLRERLGLDPGTEVEVVEEDGKAVVRPERSPEDVIETLERLVEEASATRESRSPNEFDAYAWKHAETIRRGAERVESTDE
jgi:AbrB family looped-hinge helix DNA binding protein